MQSCEVLRRRRPAPHGTDQPPAPEVVERVRDAAPSMRLTAVDGGHR